MTRPLTPAVVGAALGKVVPALVMAATAVRFVLTGLYERFGGLAWANSAGWAGIGLAGLALYAALANDLGSVCHKTVLPLGRHRAGKAALDPDIRPSPATLNTAPGSPC